MPFYRCSKESLLNSALRETTIWEKENFKYYRAVEIDNTGGADLEHYSVEITLSGANWDFSRTESDGSDIRVTDSDQKTMIPYFVEAYSVGGETGTLWVRVPYVASGGSGTIYIYYGNPDPHTFQVTPNGKWSRPSSYVMSGNAENMVYDSTTDKYYICFSDTTSGPISIASADTPSGAWTDEGIFLNPGTAGEWDDTAVIAPHLVEDGGTWYLFYSGVPDEPATVIE